jgi:predicted RNA-binding protein (virulence factor B family)
METLQENNGFLALNDKTSPEIIQALLGISKKNFKKAVGNLYKKKLIEFKSDGIKLVG